MTKRVSNSIEKNTKKQKLDDDIDALWGDDFDDSILEDCINRATQVLNEDKDNLNASILPSYNAFKEPGKICSSTQFEMSIRPGTSKTNLNKENVINYEKEIQRLQQQCEEKAGEISILRNQLSETKMHINIEQQKSQGEWKNKLGIKEKQIQSMKSELEFKNLEIANLKQSQKVVDFSKFSLNASMNTSKMGTSKQIIKQTVVKTVTEQSRAAKDKLHIIADPVYPLKRLVSKMTLNNPKIEKHIIENKLTHSSKNAIPYLKNQTVSTSVVVEESHVDMDNVIPVMVELAECTKEELNMRENITNINKVVCISLQLLTDLEDLLERIKNNLGTEDILEADSIYLKKNFLDKSCKRDEMGMKSGLVVSFLAELFPYCEYLSRYILGEKLINLSEQDSIVKQLPYMLSKRFHTGLHFLNKLINIAKIIGEIRKAEAMSTFLRSSLTVFTNICKLKKYESDFLFSPELVCSFTRELIFLRPPPQIVLDITYLFKEASQCTSFIEFLLNKAKSCSTTKKGVVYFNNDACRFYIFGLMFDRCIYKLNSIPLDVSLNLLCFMYNTYKSSFFVHHQNAKECECLPQLYKLEVEILYRALERHKEFKNGQSTNEWDTFFKNKITVKMLSLMAFHSYELAEKYITVYSQFKEIERHLQEEESLDLDRLNINEDMPEIDSKKFENINFE
nr:uncharacterized protein LOC111502441 isoform X1 [Leptinotarsa decemlineata]